MKIISKAKRVYAYYRDSISLAETSVERNILLPYLLGSCVTSLLPRIFHTILSFAVGTLRYIFIPSKRKGVRFGQRLASEHRGSKVRLEYHTFLAFVWHARRWIEAFSIAGCSDEEIEYHCQVEGIEYFYSALAASNGKGIVAISGHVGNLDWMGSLMINRGIPSMSVMTKLSPAILERWMIDMRERRGIKMETLGENIAAKVRVALRDGYSVALMSDYDVTGTGIAVNIFGDNMKIPAGPAVFCARLGVPLVPMAAYMRHDGGHILKFWPPILPPNRESAPAGERIALTAELVARAVEDTIRFAPTQWMFGNELRARRGKVHTTKDIISE